MKSIKTNVAILLALGLCCCLVVDSLNSSSTDNNNQTLSPTDESESNESGQLLISQKDQRTKNENIDDLTRLVNLTEINSGNNLPSNDSFIIDTSAVDYEIGEDASRSSMTAIETGSIRKIDSDDEFNSSDLSTLDSIVTTNGSQVTGNSDPTNESGNDENDYNDSSSSSSLSSSSAQLSAPSSSSPSVKSSTESEALEMLLNFLKDSVGKMLKAALPTIVQSGMEANVSAQCANSFMVLTSGLQQGKDWAFRMLDSSGKPPSGILEGTLTDFGSFEQCIDLRVPSNDPSAPGERDYLEGRYCVMDIKAALEENVDVARRPSNIPEDSVVWNRALREFWSRNSLLSFRYGLCIPSACHREEITELANYLAEPTGMEVNVNYCQTKKGWKIDKTQITIISILSAIMIMVIIGTITELILSHKSEKKLFIGDERSWKHFILAFSLKRNTKKLLDAGKKPYSSPLRHLDGIRFFSVLWIIMGHTYFYTDFVHYHHYRRLKHIQEIDDDFIFMPIANFTLSVNTFFFISGLLVVYANWKKLTVSEGKISITDFFIHKVWRIWPPYLATIGLVMIMPLIGSGPLWPQAVENTAQLCRKNWWTNILFLNNFLAPDQLCLLHTWFLAAHMQFHLFSAIILYILYRFPKLTILLLSFFTILSGIGVYIYTIINNLRWPTVIADAVFTDYTQRILTLYIMPYNHLGSYLVGIVGGYYLVKYKNSMISTKTQTIAWIGSLSMMSLIIFAPHSAFAGTMPSLTEAAVYLSVHRTAWAIALGWLIFACSTERGGFINSLLSWNAFGPLSNLSYLAYLVHPLLMLFHTGRTRERVYFGHYELFNIFLARTVMAFFLAYILYVTVELPFAALEKYIFHKKPKNRPETVSEYRANAIGPVFAIVGKNIPHLTSSKKVTSDSV